MAFSTKGKGRAKKNNKNLSLSQIKRKHLKTIIYQKHVGVIASVRFSVGCRRGTILANYIFHANSTGNQQTDLLTPTKVKKKIKGKMTIFRGLTFQEGIIYRFLLVPKRVVEAGAETSLNKSHTNDCESYI